MCLVFALLLSLFSHQIAAFAKCYDNQEVFNANTVIHLGSIVEPTIAVNPKNKKNIVVAWQKDRISNGYALEIGIAATHDLGKTWKETKIPFQICQGGFTSRVTDSWLSFSKDGKSVFLANAFANANTLPKTNKQAGIAVVVSRDGGKNWSRPAILDSSRHTINNGKFTDFDKESITCDLNNAKRAYTVWAAFDPPPLSSHSIASFARTKNQGKSWKKPITLYDPFPDLLSHHQSNGIKNDCNVNNNIIVSLPSEKNGDLINFMVRAYAKPTATNLQFTKDSWPFKFTIFDIALVRSKNNGKTWEKNASVITRIRDNPVFTGGYTYSNGEITGGIGTKLRDNSVNPIFACNPKSGILYAVWQSEIFRSDKLPQIALSFSKNGGKSWSKPIRVNRTPQNSPNPQAFSPFIAINTKGHVGILYFDFRKDDKKDANKTKTDAWLAFYEEKEGKLSFQTEVRLSKASYIAQNGPTTSLGVMLDADYPFLVARENLFYAIHTESLKGPFKPLELFLDDPTHHATIQLDKNCRQIPLVTIIENNESKGKIILRKKFNCL